MPISPNDVSNFEGGSSDFWSRYMDAHWQQVADKALIHDGMTQNYGGGETNTPPHGLRFMEDAQAAGSLVVAGERFDA